MLALFAAASLLAADPTCAPPPGAEALWTPEARYVIVGEIHGTTETPAAFAQLVCAAAEQGPVTVALELPTEMQPQLDAFLIATDDASAAATLHETSFWVRDPERQDGRSSMAMLEMMQSIRRLKAGGGDVAFRAFQPSNPRSPAFDQNYYELDMAVELSRPRPSGLTPGCWCLSAMSTPAKPLLIGSISFRLPPICRERRR